MQEFPLSVLFFQKMSPDFLLHAIPASCCCGDTGSQAQGQEPIQVAEGASHAQDEPLTLFRAG